ncbi:MAG: hypothetical protein IKT12_05945, partial [Thermoguttaceae bacterium]|nr:hypothetical protein [Thermoguttaceae bacterium]
TTINDSKIMNNTASGSGGGIWAANKDLTVNYTWITGNTAGNNGGGIYADLTSITLYQSLIADNTANGTSGASPDIRGGGGIYTNNGSSTARTVTNILWSTVAGNSAPNGSGNDIYGNSSYRTTTISYSIVGETAFRQGEFYYVDSCYKSISGYDGWIHIDTDSYRLQEGDILFVGGDDIETKYTLAAGSVAIDATGVTASDTTVTPNPTKDLNDKTRPVGRSQDRGAFEYLGNRVIGLSKVYDGTSQSLVELDGTVVPASVEYSTDGGTTWSSTEPTYRNVGTYPISVRYTTIDGDTETVQVTGAITPKAITLTPVPQDKPYDGTNVVTSITGTLSGQIEGDAVALDTISGTFADSNVGTWPVTVSYTLTGADKDNYEVTVANSQASITPAAITGLEFLDVTCDYDALAHALVLSGTQSGDVVSFSLDGETWNLTTIPSYTNAGTYTVYAKVNRGSNYTVWTDDATLTIKAIPITVTGTTVADKNFDGNAVAPVTLGTVSGILPADAANISVSASGVFADYVPATYTDGVTVTYSFTGDSSLFGNYYLNPASETFTATINGPETPSMHVTTASDTVDPWDGLISLREALTVYYKASETITYNTDGTFGYTYNGTNTTVTFEDTLTTMQLNSGFNLGTAVNANGDVIDYDGLVIQGINNADQANHIAFDGDAYGEAGQDDFGIFGISKAANVTFNNLIFKNVKKAGAGAAILVVSGLTVSGQAVTVNGCEFTSNSGTLGAAITVISPMALNIADSTFTGNSVTGSQAYGGAVFTQGGALSVTNSEFTANTASMYGGAVFSNGGQATITDTVFNGNTASIVAGAVYAKKLNVSGSTFKNNVAGGNPNYTTSGGAIYFGAETTALNIASSTFEGNSAEIGGAINVAGSGAVLTVDGSTFKSNSSNGQGGAICAGTAGAAKTVTITNSVFESNTAAGFSGYGGAFCAMGSSSSASDRPTVTIEGSTFYKNKSTGTAGGAIMFRYADFTMRYCWVVANEAAGHGGAIYAEYGQNLTVYESLIAENVGSTCGGIYQNRISSDIQWSTVAGNKTAGGTSQDLYVDGAQNIDVRASLTGSIVLTAGANEHGWVHYHESLYETKPVYSTVYANSTEYHSGETLFVGGTDYREAYKLAVGSVAIDATAVSTGPAKDLAGSSRPVNNIQDYGAFEFLDNRITGLTKVYDGTYQNLVSIDSTIVPSSVEYSVDGTTWSTTAPTYHDVGSYPIHVRYTDVDGNSGTTLVTGVITPKQLTVAASAETRPYNGTDTANITLGDVSGVCEGDSITVTAAGVFTTKNVNDAGVPVTYSISGTGASNYTKPADETLTASITPAIITVSGYTVE